MFLTDTGHAWYTQRPEARRRPTSSPADPRPLALAVWLMCDGRDDHSRVHLQLTEARLPELNDVDAQDAVVLGAYLTAFAQTLTEAGCRWEIVPVSQPGQLSRSFRMNKTRRTPDEPSHPADHCRPHRPSGTGAECPLLLGRRVKGTPMQQTSSDTTSPPVPSLASPGLGRSIWFGHAWGVSRPVRDGDRLGC